jgi:hypothetical protein
MIAEYALIPDIFDGACYSAPAVCDVHLAHLKPVLLEEALVRDLAGGKWSAYVSANPDRWHQRAKELYKKLVLQRRLRRARPECAGLPATDAEWCVEALASNRTDPLSGIIAGRDIAAAFTAEPKIAEIEKLSSASWWQNRGPSKRIRRDIADYLGRLRLILGHANSLMFIDPHVNPERHGYGEFLQLLVPAASRQPTPRIEIHRVCYVGSPQNRVFPDWPSIFLKSHWAAALSLLGAHAEVFIWDDFHDRYLISDLVGIQTPNGFDVSHDREELTTWTRLSRNDRDDVQREFDPAARRHKLQARLRIGSPG